MNTITNNPQSKWYTVTTASGEVTPNNTICYGPYASLLDALKAIRNLVGENELDTTADPYIPAGWTCGIIENNKVVEYWLPSLVEEGHTAVLEKKNDCKVELTENGFKIGEYTFTISE